MSKCQVIEFNGLAKTIPEWAEYIGIPEKTLRSRISKKMPLEKALNKNVKGKYQGKFESEKHICWDCKNAVPTADGIFGCNWSRYLKPVKGWIASPTKITSYAGKGKDYFVNSFSVIKCPEFIKG